MKNGLVNLSDKIYEIRGEKIMLDYDLANIYGYTTSAFNQQVSRNIEKFEGSDFMFRLNAEDLSTLSLSQNVIAIQQAGDKKGGRSILPRAFTESGIYMLMTVLRGDLAVKQSRALIRAFREMKEYIIHNNAIISEKEQLRDWIRAGENARRISDIEDKVSIMDDKIKMMSNAMQNVVLKSEISPILLDFNKNYVAQEYVLMNGQTAKAEDAYIKIYSKASQSIYIIDNYIDIGSLRMLMKIRENVKVVIFSDNIGRYLGKMEYNNFRNEYPNIRIDFYQTCKKVHDRFIVLDYGFNNETIYHCGASSKDAGNHITAISQLREEIAHNAIHEIFETLFKNPKLKLK